MAQAATIIAAHERAIYASGDTYQTAVMTDAHERGWIADDSDVYNIILQDGSRLVWGDFSDAYAAQDEA